jgi:hypothetical protein
MRYTYFIRYSHPAGFGRCEITINKKITSIQDIAAVEKIIKDGSGLSVIVENYSLLRTEQAAQ